MARTAFTGIILVFQLFMLTSTGFSQNSTSYSPIPRVDVHAHIRNADLMGDYLELLEPAQTAYEERPDLAISSSGIQIDENEVTVRVYSQGAVASPESTLELKNARGESVGTMPVPAMEAPLDLNPNSGDRKLTVPPGTDLSSGSIQVDPEKKITQITRINTLVQW